MTAIVLGLPYLRAGDLPPCTEDPYLFDALTVATPLPSAIRAARQVCAGCPALLPCRVYGESEEGRKEEGFWGGLTEAERNGRPTPPRLTGRERTERDIADLEDGTMTISSIAIRDRCRQDSDRERLRKYGYRVARVTQ